MWIQPIETERLRLVPFTLTAAAGVLRGDFEEWARAGIRPAAGWPDQEALDTMPKIIRNLERAGAPTGFESWVIVKKPDMTVIGDAGFKGGPGTHGGVDLGYAIIEAEQRKGYASEAAAALTEWALSQAGVRKVTARCFEWNGGSARVLQKLGFRETSREREMIHWEKAHG